MGRWKPLIVPGTAATGLALVVLGVRQSGAWGLKIGLLAAAGTALGRFWPTRRLPGERRADERPRGGDTNIERPQPAAPQL
jgi:hypothetical protein